MSMCVGALASDATQPPPASATTATQQCLLLGHRLNVSTDVVCDGLRGGAAVGRSLKGHSVFAFTDARENETNMKYRVMVLGAIHGDETSAGWLTFQWLADTVHAGKVPSNIAIRVLPVANPDSALSRPLRRTNANGVDLNRNFPTKNWATESVKWWTETTKKDPRRWPGNTPNSELETRIIMKEIDAFKPTVIVSVHAPFGLLDFDGPGPAPTRIGSLRLDTVGVYPGSLGNYASQVRGIPVITLELPAAMKATTAAESAQMWKDLVSWLNARPNLVGKELPKTKPS